MKKNKTTRRTARDSRSPVFGNLLSVLFLTSCSVGSSSNRDSGNGESANEDAADSFGGEQSPESEHSPNEGGRTDESSTGGRSESEAEDLDSHSMAEEEEDSDRAENESVPRFDVGVFDADDGIPETEVKRSYIWIANTREGTVSKINTRTLVEEGRYPTAPSPNNPSRTSVSLSGDVAVSGRQGGIIKIYANLDDCIDKNGSGTIDTSTDGTPLAFDEEECIAWYVETPINQRGTAWTQGTYDPETEEYSGQDLWVGATENTQVVLYDGETGGQLGVATAPDNEGAYGGAVDEKGDFWFTPRPILGLRTLRKADIETFGVTTYSSPGESYGMTYGGKDGKPGYVWVCSGIVSRFDPRTETWRSGSGDFGFPEKLFASSDGGCMVDANGLLWHKGSPSEPHPGGGWKQSDSAGIFAIDTDTFEIVKVFELPSQPHGVAIDFDGYVWGVSRNGNEAYRLDPDDGSFKTFDQLVGAYTYSDMTGFALAKTVVPIE